jgi:hypothetical protein
MNTSAWVITAVIALLVAGVFFAGCSDESSTTTGDSATQVTVTTSEATSVALYRAGDIVKNPKSTVNTGLLILSYDAGSDMYERAMVYPNSDGSWGYRLDSKTAKVSRSTIEKTYTEKVENVAVSSITIGAPTTATTVPTTVATKVTTVAATTTTLGYAPKITEVTPESGKTGTNVSLSVTGQNFQSNAKVSLIKSGKTITATGASLSNNVISCTISIPSDASLGWWDVAVTNPDGQTHKFMNGLNVLQGATTTTTTSTTSSAATTKVTITQIQDTLLGTGNTAADKTVTILGTNLSVVSNMKLTGTSTITARTYTATSSTMATGYFDLPAGSGADKTYNVVLIDASGNTLATSSDTVTIR